MLSQTKLQRNAIDSEISVCLNLITLERQGHAMKVP